MLRQTQYSCDFLIAWFEIAKMRIKEFSELRSGDIFVEENASLYPPRLQQLVLPQTRACLGLAEEGHNRVPSGNNALENEHRGGKPSPRITGEEL
jgi:hypothetical protein